MAKLKLTYTQEKGFKGRLRLAIDDEIGEFYSLREVIVSLSGYPGSFEIRGLTNNCNILPEDTQEYTLIMGRTVQKRFFPGCLTMLEYAQAIRDIALEIRQELETLYPTVTKSLEIEV